MNTINTTWQALVKIASIHNRPFYYYEYENYYELLFTDSPLVFHAVMKKDGNKETQAFETNWKSGAIPLL